MGNIQTLEDGTIEDLYLFDSPVDNGKRGPTYGYYGIVRPATRRRDGLKLSVKIIHKANLSKSALAIIHDEIEILQKVCMGRVHRNSMLALLCCAGAKSGVVLCVCVCVCVCMLKLSFLGAALRSATQTA